MTGLYAGQAIGRFGATIAVVLSRHTTLWLFGLVEVAYSILLAFTLKDIKRIPASDSKTVNSLPVGKSLATLFTNISCWIILCYFCIPGISGWATKNWLPTLFSESLGIGMEVAEPVATISIAVYSLLGVLSGGFLSDSWEMRNVCGRIYTGAIGLILIIPSLLFIGYGTTLSTAILGAVLFGIVFGMFDANNMPIMCQFVPSSLRVTAYGIMNMNGVLTGKSSI